MAKIGTFTKIGSEFHGEIITLSVQAKDVRIVPISARLGKDGPTHRVCVGRAEIGAVWERVAEAGDYLSVTLDDPSFTGPIQANLVPNDQDESFTLVWVRNPA